MKSFNHLDYNKVIADPTIEPRELIAVTGYCKEQPDAFYWICKEEWEKLHEWGKEMEKKLGRYIWTGKHEEKKIDYVENWKQSSRTKAGSRSV